MPTEFDTSGIAASDRARLVTDRLAAAVGRCRVSHLCDGESVWARWRCVRLSPTTGACLVDGSAVRLTRRAADVVDEPVERLTFAVPDAEGGSLWQGGWFRRLRPDELVLVDAGRPYDYRGRAGPLSVVQLNPVGLGVSPSQTHAAASRLQESPLHDLARDHVRALAALAVGPGTGSTAAGDLGAATTLLLAALLLSCGDMAG